MRASDRTRTAYALLGLAVAVALLGAGLTYVLLREYGDTNGSGLVQGLRDAVLPGAVVLVVAAVAFSLRPTRRVAALTVATVLLAVLGTGLAGYLAVQGKYAAYPRTPDCTGTDAAVDDKDATFEPATSAALARIQGALDTMEHPAPFFGTLEVGRLEPDGATCVAGLATNDLPKAVGFYRIEVSGHGWTLQETSAMRLEATRDGLTLTVDEGDGGAVRVRMTSGPP